jgi:hypothetical protein
LEVEMGAGPEERRGELPELLEPEELELPDELLELDELEMLEAPPDFVLSEYPPQLGSVTETASRPKNRVKSPHCPLIFTRIRLANMQKSLTAPAIAYR